MLEGRNLLDGDLLLLVSVPGLDHSTVGSLAEILDRFIPRSNLTDGWIKLLEEIKTFVINK